MFDMLETGRRIASARKEKNMTQMELADKLGISYQAVSNWERGNSMPDISKLMELTEYLDMTVDELLGKESALINGLLTQGTDYLEENEVSVEEMEDAAPLLKPKQIESAVEKNEDKLKNLSDISKFAPFLGTETCDKLLRKFGMDADEKSLCRIASCASREALSEVLKERAAGGQEVGKLIVFAGKDFVDAYALEEYRKKGMAGLKKIAFAVSGETLERIADEEYKVNGFKNFKYIAPFLGKKVWGKYAGMD